MKYIATYLGALLLAACAFVSCDKDSDEGRSLQLDPALQALDCTAAKTVQTFTVYSDYSHWQVSPAYGADAEWVDVWPAEGDFDGRFSVTVSANATAYMRTTELTVRAGGKILARIPVRQSGSEFSLSINVPGNKKNVSSEEQSLEVIVTSSASWRAVVLEGDTWLTLDETLPTRQNIGISANDTGAERTGTIRFYVPGAELKTDLQIVQTAN